MDSDDRSKSSERWHVGKEIPIALIFSIFMQTAGGVWWAATLSTKLDDLSYQVAAINADKYTKTDAQKDGALYTQQISEVKNRVDRVEQLTYRRQ